MAQDFLGSIAQEDVQFTTSIHRNVVNGENYYSLLVFIEGTLDGDGKVESGKFLTTNTDNVKMMQEAFVAEGTLLGTDYRIAQTNKDTWKTFVEPGTMLWNWLQDYFHTNHSYYAYLCICTAPIANAAGQTQAVSDLAACFELVKDYAYHKTVCMAYDDQGEDVFAADVAVQLAKSCASDSLLSGAPYLPCFTPDDYENDPVYAALKAADDKFGITDAFMCAYSDKSRNGALVSLSLAMSLLNGSGTCVGNSIDFVATSQVGCSGKDGTALSVATRNILKGKNIQFFKYVGDSTGNVAAVGVKTLNGKFQQAQWIVAYINFMSKVGVAQYITQPNRLRNSATYSQVVSIMSTYVSLFGPSGSGRLSSLAITAPPFEEMPPAEHDEIIIQNAWVAVYTDQVHKVQVSGTLSIGG